VTDSRATNVKVALVAVVFFAILCARRGQQLLHPQVWDEDGVIILRDLAQVGPGSLVQPVNGYLVSIDRLISATGLFVSVAQYPAISTILAWAFIIAALLAVSFSPLVIRGGPLLAIGALLVPTDPEVFGIPLYAFWWAGLLIIAAALWRPRAPGLAWRIGFVMVGGLSSPVILLGLPLFLVRAAVFRRDRGELITAGVAVVCAAIQLFTLHNSPFGVAKSLLSVANLLPVPAQFLGNYLVGSLARTNPSIGHALLLAAGSLSLVVVAAAVWNDRRHVWIWLTLLYLWFGSIALSSQRIDVAAINPVTAGPRYFFYPFVFEAWFFLYVAFASSSVALRRAAVAILAIATINALPALNRTHDDLHWAANVANCARFPDDAAYPIPVQFDGHGAAGWVLSWTGSQCRSLAARDLLARLIPPLGLPPVPYHARAFTAAEGAPELFAPIASVVADGWRGTDVLDSRLPGFVVIGSYRAADADEGTLTLKLDRGARVLYRSGPSPNGNQKIIVRDASSPLFRAVLPIAPDWLVLEFDDPRLPDHFQADFEDDGSALGEWSALALSDYVRS
jgi:hypothetical protein